MGIVQLSESDNGYGAGDREMADALRGARTREEADEIARERGLEDADDAASWLRERS
jgi:hypothetical protein